MNEIITVNNLSKRFITYNKRPGLKGTFMNILKREYKEVCALDNISFKISKGEFVGLIGPNGAGKSTTLKCLSGLIEPTDGRIEVLGYKPGIGKSEYLKRISFVMGSKNQLWWDLPALETLELTKVIYDIDDKDFNNRVDKFLELLDLRDISRKPVRELSLGQRMKFELVNSLIYMPEVLFLDEPTIGLDVVMQEKIRQFLKEFNKEYNSTVMLTSHYMEDVEDLCSRVILINKGKILFDGTVTDLKKKFSIGKRIAFKSDNKVLKKDFNKYGELISKDGMFNITVKDSQVNNISKEILNKYKVEDFEISGVPLEQVVKNVFKNQT